MSETPIADALTCVALLIIAVGMLGVLVPIRAIGVTTRWRGALVSVFGLACLAVVALVTMEQVEVPVPGSSAGIRSTFAPTLAR